MSENIINWLIHGRMGISSKAMAAVALDKAPENKFYNHPHDPADFNRCLELVKAAPEVREAFPKIAALSPAWKTIIDHWDELKAIFIEEVGENWEQRSKAARKTYDKMQSLLASARS